MSNIVKHTQFKRVVQELWTRAKNKFVTNITLTTDSTGKKILNKVIDTNTTPVTNVITTWGDLEEVTEYKYVNLLDYSKRIENKWYGDTTGAEQNNGSWNIYKANVKPSGQYTVLKSRWDTNRFVFLNANGEVVQVQEFNSSSVNSWQRQYVTVPSDSNIVQMGFCSQKAYNNGEQLMVLEGANITETLQFIPYLDGGKVSVNEKICHTFNNANTSLSSKSVYSAIKEIDTRLQSCVNKGDSKIVIGGHTSLVDANILGRNAHKFQNARLNEISTKETEFFSCGEFNAGGQVKITQVTIAMDENIASGTVVNGVNIAVATHSSGTQYFIRPQDVYMSNETAVVYETTDHATLGSRKAITIDIDITLTTNQRLVIGAKGMRWGASSSSSSTSGENFPSKGGSQSTVINFGNNGGKVGSAILHADETPLRTLVKDVRHTRQGQITVVKADGSETVINVNGNPSFRLGEVRKYMLDFPTMQMPSKYSSNSYDALGKMALIEDHIWLKCEGQRIPHINNGQNVTLPTSTEYENIYICIGKLIIDEESATANIVLGEEAFRN